MLYTALSIIGILFTIFFVIGTHEYAHFMMARLLGVGVLRFSIGFGKTLWRRVDKKGTEYVIALVPLGGYVKMLDENEESVPKHQLKYAFNHQPFYKKFLIVAAGPAMNFLCAILLYWLIYMVGFTTLKPVTGYIHPNSIAAQAGLKPNEEIIAIDHHDTKSWTGILFRLLTHIGDQDIAVLTVRSLNGKTTSDHSLNLANWKMDALTPDPLSSLGITPYEPPIPLIIYPDNMLRKVQYNPLAAFAQASRQVYEFSYFNLILFGKIITGKLSLQSLGGPITIFESAGAALNYGWLPFVGFLAFLSASIGIINVLPIPGLDGGHLMFETIELIIRRPLPQRFVAALYYGGFALIVFILIQALVNDVLRLT